MYKRGDEEFSRALALSDGVFAIAMTLLVVGLTVPHLSNHDSVRELHSALDDLVPAVISFFISFAFIGRYWMAHHEFVGRLKQMDTGLLGLNLVYLSFISFLPFPTALLGTYFDNPLSIGLYAVNMALVSGMEVMLFRHAQNHDLLTTEMPPDVYRWGQILSLSPVVFFVISVPVAFVASSGLAVCCWALGIPFQAFAQRWKPDEADEYFRGARVRKCSAEKVANGLNPREPDAD